MSDAGAGEAGPTAGKAEPAAGEEAAEATGSFFDEEEEETSTRTTSRTLERCFLDGTAVAIIVVDERKLSCRVNGGHTISSDHSRVMMERETYIYIYSSLC